VKEEEKGKRKSFFCGIQTRERARARANKQLCAAREKYLSIPLQPISLTSWLPKEGIHPKGTHPSNLMGIPLKVCVMLRIPRGFVE